MRRYHPLTGAELGEIITAMVTRAIASHGLFQHGMTYPLASVTVMLNLSGQQHELAALAIDDDTAPDALRSRYGLPLLDTVQVGTQVVDVPDAALTVTAPESSEPLPIGSYVHHPQFASGHTLLILAIEQGFYRLKNMRTSREVSVSLDSAVGQGFKLTTAPAAIRSEVDIATGGGG